MPFDATPIETKPDVFSLEGLIAWLETQDPMTKYDYCNAGECLISKYARQYGFSNLDIWSSHSWDYRHRDGRTFDLTLSPLREVAGDLPRTHGAALTRAKALQQNSG